MNLNNKEFLRVIQTNRILNQGLRAGLSLEAIVVLLCDHQECLIKLLVEAAEVAPAVFAIESFELLRQSK